jgi:hypothetical protein
LILPFSRVFQWSRHDQFTVTLYVVFCDISNKPKLVIAISGWINITNIATYQYKTTFDIISLKYIKRWRINKYIFTILNTQHTIKMHTQQRYIYTWPHSQVTRTILCQSVGADVKGRQNSLLRNNSGNPNSIVVNFNVLCDCKEKWKELEF